MKVTMQSVVMPSKLVSTTPYLGTFFANSLGGGGLRFSLGASANCRFALANRCFELIFGSSSFGVTTNRSWLDQHYLHLSLGPGSHTLSPPIP